MGKIYCPPIWLKALCSIGILAGGVGVYLIVVERQHDIISYFLVGFGLLAIYVVIDLSASKVEVKDECLVIKNIIKTEKLNYDQISSVKIDGGIIVLTLKSGEFKKLPNWLGGNMSARKQIGNKVNGA